MFDVIFSILLRLLIVFPIYALISSYLGVVSRTQGGLSQILIWIPVVNVFVGLYLSFRYLSKFVLAVLLVVLLPVVGLFLFYVIMYLDVILLLLPNFWWLTALLVGLMLLTVHICKMFASKINPSELESHYERRRMFTSRYVGKIAMTFLVLLFFALLWDSDPWSLVKILIVIGIILAYVLLHYPLMYLANRKGYNGSFALVPVLNIYLILKIASKPVWWVITFIVNVILSLGMMIFSFTQSTFMILLVLNIVIAVISVIFMILSFMVLLKDFGVSPVFSIGVFMPIILSIVLWSITLKLIKNLGVSFNDVFMQDMFDSFVSGSGIFLVLVLSAVFLSLVFSAIPSITKFGFGFIVGSEWSPDSENPSNSILGALPFLVGTLLTSFIALLISLVFAMSIAILLGEYFRKGFAYNLFKTIIDLLAGIPSIIYGFFGLFVARPVFIEFEKFMGVRQADGLGIFTSSCILAIMIIPYSASLARDVIELVPQSLKEAAYSLGSTRFEVIKKVVIPYSISGIFAGVILSLGRALGETMAVTMLIGNKNALPDGIFDAGNTMASIIANGFAEAGGLQSSALIEMGLILMLITAVINIISRFIIKKFSV